MVVLSAMMLLTAAALAADAPDKKELYTTAETAAAAGKIEESQKAYCQVAKIDAKFKDSKMLCTIMTEELQREKVKNDERFNLGVKQFAEGKFDAAQHEFANIRWGVHLEEAKLYLTVKIPQARQKEQKH
jgi:hypothetical protein